MRFAVVALGLARLATLWGQALTPGPLTPRQKFDLAVDSSTNPVNLVGAAFNAVMSQAGDWNPQYGRGSVAFAERFGASTADMVSGNFFSKALVAPLVHQDPRYFRKGPGTGIRARMLYAVTREFVGRSDYGRPMVNASDLLGTVMSSALSEAYYPPASIDASTYGWRVFWGVVGSALTNLAPEFWPDIRRKLFGRRHDRKGRVPP